MTRTIDPIVLSRIKLERAITDPITYDEGMAASGYQPTDTITNCIHAARLRQAKTTPPDEPVRKASWLETALGFSTVSLQAPLTQAGQQHYKWAMHKALQAPEFPPDDHPVDPPSFLSDLPDLPKHLRPELARTRRRLKITRDKHFFETQYDPELGIPKALWTDYHTGSVTYDDADFVRDPDTQSSADAPA